MSDYWQRRKALNMYQYMKSAEETADEISKIYHKASMVLSNEMDKIFERFITKHKLSEDDARKLLLSIKDRNSLEDIKAELRKGAAGSDKRRLLAELESPAYASRLNRLQEKQQQIDTLMNTVYSREKSISTDHYKELMNESYNRSMYEIQRQSGIGFSFNNIDKNTVDSLLKSKWSGANYSERIWSNTQKLADSLKTELMVGLLTGEREAEISKNILYQFACSANSARRLVRTESCYIANEMDMKAYEESGIDTYVFVATLDLKTSAICASLDGKRFKVKDRQSGVNAPPMHPWCRSVTVCDISDKELSQMQRRSKNPVTGKSELVPANMTYEEWKKSFVERNKSELQPAKTDDIIKAKEPSEAMQIIQKQCEVNNIEHRGVKKLQKELSSDEIIERLAGGDMTKGSCSSLAFAYIGNRNGLDVIDFRGGNSQHVFSLKSNIEKMLELPGVKGSITMVQKEISGTMEVLNNLELNKEYYLVTGKHAAIVRRVNSGVEYLELQSKYQNGWTSFDKYGSMSATLNKRFGCRKTVDKSFGKVWEKSVVLMDVESFNENTEFEQILGYINTALESQKKGVTGDVK